jgi:hypothetical protein
MPQAPVHRLQRQTPDPRDCMIHFNTELGILVLLAFAFIDFGLAAWNRQFRTALGRFGSRFVAIGITVTSTMLVGSRMVACFVALFAWTAIATLPKYRKGADHVQWFWRMVHGTSAICIYTALTAAR